MRKINVYEFVSLDGVIDARAGQRKIPMARRGGYVHIVTLRLIGSGRGDNPCWRLPTEVASQAVPENVG